MGPRQTAVNTCSYSTGSRRTARAGRGRIVQQPFFSLRLRVAQHFMYRLVAHT